MSAGEVGTTAEPLIDGVLAANLGSLLGAGASSDLEHGTALARCARALHRAGISLDRPVCAFFVPGRIEVLGKHTDYAGGRSLLAALERGFTVLASPREDDVVSLIDAGSSQRARFHLTPELRPIPGGWRTYPMTVARRVARNFGTARIGVDIAFMSDLPAAAGLSSSSAFVVGTFLALATANRLGEDPAWREWVRCRSDLADYLGAVENGLDFRGLVGDLGVGTRGGSQDQTAILCARPGSLVQYGFGPVRFEREVPLPPGYTFAIACSGVRASKIGGARGAYNNAAATAAELLRLWREGTGRDDRFLGAALESVEGAVELLQELIERECTQTTGTPAEFPGGSGTPGGSGGPGGPARTGFAGTAGALAGHHSLLSARLEQFAAEALEIIPAAGDALAAGDFDTFGRLVDRSQHLAERGLGNQVEETVFLQRTAREAGAIAASAFGAGFGGSVWALVPKVESAEFLGRWRSAYEERSPALAAQGEFFVSHATAAARRVV